MLRNMSFNYYLERPGDNVAEHLAGHMLVLIEMSHKQVLGISTVY